MSLSPLPTATEKGKKMKNEKRKKEKGERKKTGDIVESFIIDHSKKCLCLIDNGGLRDTSQHQETTSDVILYCIKRFLLLIH